MACSSAQTFKLVKGSAIAENCLSVHAYQSRESINRAAGPCRDAANLNNVCCAQESAIRFDQVEREGDRPYGGCSIGMPVAEPCQDASAAAA